MLHSLITFKSARKEVMIRADGFSIQLSNGFGAKVQPGHYCFDDIKKIHRATGSFVVDGSMKSLRVIYLDTTTGRYPLVSYLYDYVTGKTRTFFIEPKIPFVNTNAFNTQFNSPSGLISRLMSFAFPITQVDLFDIIPFSSRERLVQRLEEVLANDRISFQDAVYMMYDMSADSLAHLKFLINYRLLNSGKPFITTEDGVMSFGDERATCIYSMNEFDAIVRLTELPFKSFSVTIDFANHGLDSHKAEFIDDPSMNLNGDLCLLLVNETIRDFLTLYCNAEYTSNACYSLTDPVWGKVYPTSIVITKTADEVVSLNILVNETILNRTYDTIAMMLVSPYILTNHSF